MARAIGIIGKVPAPGTVKTRLIPPLDPQQAARLYDAFLRDAIHSALRLPDVAASLILPSTADATALTTWLPDTVTLVQERGSNVGDAMSDAFQTLFSWNASSVVLVGSDLPTLPSNYIEEAFIGLESSITDVVLGPAEDGGYYLIGLRRYQPVLFDGISWSTDRVLGQTLERARSAGLQTVLLPTWYDVDHPDDLQRLALDLAQHADSLAPATRGVLRSLRQNGLPLPAMSSE